MTITKIYLKKILSNAQDLSFVQNQSSSAELINKSNEKQKNQKIKV